MNALNTSPNIYYNDGRITITVVTKLSAYKNVQIFHKMQNVNTALEPITIQVHTDQINETTGVQRYYIERYYQSLYTYQNEKNTEL